MTIARRVRRQALGVALLIVAAGCGVPTGGPPETIPASDVPVGLASPGPTVSVAPSSPARLDQPRIYLVADDGALVPQGRELSAGTLRSRLDELLGDLAAGPTAVELNDRLSSALRPDTTLAVADLSDGTAIVDVGGGADAPAGGESRRAVGQIVLTATSLPGVDSVLLTSSGERFDAPLPSGQLTAQPLRAADYTTLLTPSPAPPS